MLNSISVGLGELIFSRDPADVLVAFGLGSCLGITVFDPITRTSGLLHAVLPTRINRCDDLSAKYVDSGIELIVDNLVKAKIDPKRCTYKMAGGANMLISSSLSNTFDIGSRNIESALLVFRQLNLRLSAQETGGNIGRTVRLYAGKGRMTVRKIGSHEVEL